jgi:hypothetical protein
MPRRALDWTAREDRWGVHGFAEQLRCPVHVSGKWASVAASRSRGDEAVHSTLHLCRQARITTLRNVKRLQHTVAGPEATVTVHTSRLSKFACHFRERDHVGGLEDLPDDLVGAILVLHPQP